MAHIILILWITLKLSIAPEDFTKNNLVSILLLT